MSLGVDFFIHYIPASATIITFARMLHNKTMRYMYLLQANLVPRVLVALIQRL